jgi:hypothetical protein
MDYGHPLQFGTFITPTNAQPQAPVALARLSEDLGYDLVTFQDHPYQAAFHDTWTLLSYVAAATTTIQLSPNVLNLPLRPAPVVARSAASLDLLSGGRFNLGLGAGGFWDAIEAMGGRRLTPGQAVDALSEAIDLIRGIWDLDDRTPLRGGPYYPVRGAKRGPAPAHEIPIWLGAYKPRMLKLTGAKADGWLPSLAYMQPGDLPDSNARIDDAAADAHRAPSDIRRLLNISGREDAERIADLALTHGFSTFIVTADNPSLLRMFAEEIIPRTRELVAAERADAGIVEQTRSTRALAQRREGIAYDALPASLRDIAIEPGDFAYRTVRSTYMRGGRPGLVLQPRNVVEVAESLAFARQHPLLALGIRSGGHGISGRSTNDGGIVIDLKAMNDIEVMDVDSRRVRIGPGARWQEVAAALAPYGWAISSGDYGGVGVGGLTTAGGIGFLGREHGLTIDHLVAAEIMLADGRLVRASAEENPDLFWAVRGAGANVGIVVAFEFEAHPIGDVGWVQLIFDATDTAGLLERFGSLMEAAPRDVTMFLILGPGGAGNPPIAQMYGVVDSPDPDTILARLNPFVALGPLLNQSVQLASYAAVMANAPDGPHDGAGEPRFRSGFLAHLDARAAATAARLVTSGSSPWFQLRAVGGAIADVPADATAYAHRDANFAVTAIGNSAAFDMLWGELEMLFQGLYVSFETRRGDAQLANAFPPATLERLRALKGDVDPDVVFRDNFPVLEAKQPTA